jgi:ribosomal protein L24
MLAEAEEELKRIFTKKSSEKLREGKALYAQDKLKEAIVPLTKVTHDEGQFEEAIRMIGEIKSEINRREVERLAHIEEEKRKKREHEMAQAQLEAETERARQLAELEIATTMAAANVSSAQISADANILVAQYGVDEAELNARAAEASAQAEESKIAIEQVKKETEQVKLKQLKAQESIIVAEAEIDVAKANTIAYATRLVERQGKKEGPDITTPLSPEEISMVGDWSYLGTIEPFSGVEDYSGAGSILSIADDRTFSDEGTIGNWSIKNESFMINNSYAMPYIIESENLIMSADVNGTQYIRIYERY